MPESVAAVIVKMDMTRERRQIDGPKANIPRTLKRFQHISVVRVVHLQKERIILTQASKISETIGGTSVLPKVPVA